MLALMGPRRLWRLTPACRGSRLLALCLVNYGFVYYGQYRYRMPMEPFRTRGHPVPRPPLGDRPVHDEEAAQGSPRGPAVAA